VDRPSGAHAKAVLHRSQRVLIDHADLTGSDHLTGGRVDESVFEEYREED